jgi:siderophore synthetase component
MLRCWVCNKRIEGEGITYSDSFEYVWLTREETYNGEEFKERVDISVKLCSKDCLVAFLLMEHAIFDMEYYEVLAHLITHHGISEEELDKGLKRFMSLGKKRHKKLAKKLDKLCFG